MASSGAASGPWVRVMNPEQMIEILRHTLFTAIEIAAPFLLLALVVGVLISLFQSMTQMHEMTLSFVPKMLVVGVALAVLFPWIFKMLTKFTMHLIVDQWDKITCPADYVIF